KRRIRLLDRGARFRAPRLGNGSDHLASGWIVDGNGRAAGGGYPVAADIAAFAEEFRVVKKFCDTVLNNGRHRSLHVNRNLRRDIQRRSAISRSSSGCRGRR